MHDMWNSTKKQRGVATIMKAQVICKICETFHSYDEVCFLGNFDYEDLKDYPVNICKSCFNLIVNMGKTAEARRKITIFCSNCADSFDSNDPRIEMLTDPNGGGTYPVCGSCLQSQ